MAADGKLVFDTGIDSSGFDKGLKSLGSLAAKSAAVITAAFTVAASAAVNVGSSFTASMSQVAATMGITRMSDDYQILTASAEEMGAATNSRQHRQAMRLITLPLQAMMHSSPLRLCLLYLTRQRQAVLTLLMRLTLSPIPCPLLDCR